MVNLMKLTVVKVHYQRLFKEILIFFPPTFLLKEGILSCND